MIIFVPLGIVASIFQLVILREFNFSIAKNELTFVVAAGFWIVFCSLGSIIRTPKKLRDLALPALASITFSFSICLIHLAKSLIGLKYYEATNLGFVLIPGLILIGPVALAIGIAFRHFVQEYIQNNPLVSKTYAKFFASEAIGFFLGGVFFTLYLNDYANPLIFSLLPLILLPGIRKLHKKIISAVIIIIVSVISVVSFDLILKKEFDNADILFNLGSGYGPVIAARKSQTTILFSGGSLLATSEDKSVNEEFIHISMSAVDQKLAEKDILFIGAAVSGQAEEIIKYNLSSLDCLQINPVLSKISQNRKPGGINNKINFITDDPRLYLMNSSKKYDAILMNMPAPSNLALNRYFTEEFFKLIAGRLKTKGIFSFAIPSKREILSPQFVKFNSSITCAINNVFTNSFIIPSDSMIIIASNEQKITDDYLLENFTKAKPETYFFTIYHFKDYLAPSIRNYIQNMLDKKAIANTDLNPSSFLNYLALEQAKFYPNLRISFKEMQRAILIFLLLCGVIIIAASYLSKRASCLLNIAAVGFNSIGLLSIIFVLFQLYCGALFWKLGILIALFMGGLSIGTSSVNRINAYYANLLSSIYLLWMLTIFILFSNLETIGRLNYADFIFYFLALICGLLTGASYPLLAHNLLKNKFDAKYITTTIYSMDLVGSFLGTLICGIFLIPFLGAPCSLLSLILLNAIFAYKNLAG